MRIFTISGAGVLEASTLPTQLPEQGYVWIACGRREFEALQAQIQTTLQALCGTQLVDLHVSDLLNHQLPSHYDYTSQYDMLVFRRLSAAGQQEADAAHPSRADPTSLARRQPHRPSAAGRPFCGASTPARSALPSSTTCCSPCTPPTARSATPTPPGC